MPNALPRIARETLHPKPKTAEYMEIVGPQKGMPEAGKREKKRKQK